LLILLIDVRDGVYCTVHRRKWWRRTCIRRQLALNLHSVLNSGLPEPTNNPYLYHSSWVFAL